MERALIKVVKFTNIGGFKFVKRLSWNLKKESGVNFKYNMESQMDKCYLF